MNSELYGSVATAGIEVIENKTQQIVDGPYLELAKNSPPEQLFTLMIYDFFDRGRIVVGPNGYNPDSPFVYVPSANRMAEKGQAIALFRRTWAELEIKPEEKVFFLAIPDSNTWTEDVVGKYAEEAHLNLEVLPARKNLADLFEKNADIERVVQEFNRVKQLVKETENYNLWEQELNQSDYVEALAELGIGMVWSMPYVEGRLKGIEYLKPIFVRGLTPENINGARVIVSDDALAEGKTFVAVLASLSGFSLSRVDGMVSISKGNIQGGRQNVLNALKNIGDGQGRLVEAIPIEHIEQVNGHFEVSLNHSVI